MCSSCSCGLFSFIHLSPLLVHTLQDMFAKTSQPLPFINCQNYLINECIKTQLLSAHLSAAYGCAQLESCELIISLMICCIIGLILVMMKVFVYYFTEIAW